MVDMVTCGTVIHACGMGGLSSLALKVFSSMASSRLRADLTTYNEVLTSCERGSRWRNALELCYFMRAHQFEPDMVTKGTLACSFQQGERLGIRHFDVFLSKNRRFPCYSH